MMKIKHYVVLLTLLGLLLDTSVTSYAANTNGSDSTIVNKKDKAYAKPGKITSKVEGLTAPIPNDYTTIQPCNSFTYCPDINGRLPPDSANSPECPSACNVFRTFDAFSQAYQPAICPPGYALVGMYNLDWDVAQGNPSEVIYPITSLSQLTEYVEKGYDCQANVDAGLVQPEKCVSASSAKALETGASEYIGPDGSFTEKGSTPSTSSTSSTSSTPDTTPAPLYISLPLGTYQGITSPTGDGQLDLLINGYAGRLKGSNVTFWFNEVRVVMLVFSILPITFYVGKIGLMAASIEANIACVNPPMKPITSFDQNTCGIVPTDNNNGTFSMEIQCPVPSDYKSTTFFYQYGYAQKVSYYSCKPKAGFIQSRYKTPSTAVCVRVKQTWFQQSLPASSSPTAPVNTQGLTTPETVLPKVTVPPPVKPIETIGPNPNPNPNPLQGP